MDWGLPYVDIVIALHEILVWFDWSSILSLYYHKFIHRLEWRIYVWCLTWVLLHPVRLCEICFGVCVLLVVNITFHNLLTDKCLRYLMFVYWCVWNYSSPRDVSVLELSLGISDWTCCHVASFLVSGLHYNLVLSAGVLQAWWLFVFVAFGAIHLSPLILQFPPLE